MGASGDDTRYLYNDSKVHIWREMTANLEPGIYPSRKYDFDTLMFCFGAEPVPAQGGHSRRQSTRIWGGAGFGCALAVAYGHSRARQTPGLEQSRGVDSAVRAWPGAGGPRMRCVARRRRRDTDSAATTVAGRAEVGGREKFFSAPDVLWTARASG